MAGDMRPASDGTFARYQGVGLVLCEFQRTRGWGSTSSVVEVLTSTLPPGFKITAPKLENLFRTVDRGQPELSARLRQTFEASGDLVMSETVQGVTWSVTVGPLYIVRAEEVRRADGSPVGRVRLSLEDARYFWARGLLARWSFNRHRADGTVAMDSVKPDGSRFFKGEVAKMCAAALPGAPELAAYPTRWDQDAAPQEFPRFGIAAGALASFVNTAGLEDPCLRLDGTVGLHASGDGLLGFAPDGKGANAQAFPPGNSLNKNGTGRGFTVEPGYPEEFVLITGGDTVVTAAVDDCHPVVQLPDGQVRALTEEFMRALTDGKFGLEWLAHFVLDPPAYQHNPDLPPEVGALLADQAWRNYRLAGVEVETAAEARPASSVFGADADVVAEGGPLNGPGPNAHLLPIRPRAETANGRRQAPTVEAYSFASEHIRLRGTPSEQALAAARDEIKRLRAAAPLRPGEFANDTVLGRLESSTIFKTGQLQAADFFRADDLATRGVKLEDVESALQRAREIASYAKAPGGEAFSKALLDLTRKQIAAEEGTGAEGGRSEVFEAALLILEGEAELREELFGVADALIPTSGSFADFSEVAVNDKRFEEALARRESLRQGVLSRVQPLLIKAEAEREARRQRIATTGTAAATEEAFGRVVFGNLPRAVDTGARVIDSESGVFRLSSLGGHVSPNGASDLSYATFIPQPVRLTFGCVMRPRVDVPLQPAARVASKSAREALDRGEVVDALVGGQSVIPTALSDQESGYVSAWKRVGRGKVEKVEINQVALDRAVRLERKNMVELVRLDGTSNREDLDSQSQKLAAERANVPDVIESSRVLLARAWPVQCDGVVSSVTITMREKDGAPCGFQTLVTTGTAAAPPIGEARTQVRPRAVGGDGAARREGATS